jgi:hypothetical protein
MRTLLSISMLMLVLVGGGCRHFSSHSGVKGSGKREVQKREIGPFTTIRTEGAFNIDVVCQKDLSLEVEGDDNILPLVTAEVSNGTLYLKNNQSYSTSQPVTFRITAPNLEGLAVTGAGKIAIKGMNNEKFEIDSDGAPTIDVAGSTKLIDIDANGAGKIDAHNLEAARGVIESKGVCRVEVDIAEHLDVTVSGPSSVTYQGNPTVNKTINGPGKVERRATEGA